MDYRQLKEAKKQLEKAVQDFVYNNPNISYAIIGEKFGIDPAAVCRIAKKRGISRPIGRPRKAQQAEAAGSN